MPLTDTHIRSLKPDMKPRKYFDGGGLFLFIPTTGSKLWGIPYRFSQGCQRTPRRREAYVVQRHRPVRP